MGDSDNEADLKWILDSYPNVSLEKIVERLQKVVDINFDESDCDLESELAKRLNRDLSSNEIFRIRPILMDIEENYYGEE